MSRPRGEVRQAIAQAAQSQARCFTWQDLAQHAGVGFAAARETVRNMARAGELMVVGELRVDGVRRPMVHYAPAPPANGAQGADAEQPPACWAAAPQRYRPTAWPAPRHWRTPSNAPSY